MQKLKKSIIFIGAGNLATQLSIALKKAGHEIIQVYSRTEKSAVQLADRLETSFTTNIKEIRQQADIYIIALSDDVLDEVIQQIDFGNKLVIHTAGSVCIDIFKGNANNYGVLYPLQTFSKFRQIDFKNIPLFIEANTCEDEDLLISVGKQISNKVYNMSSEKRKILHLAAVFACNFTNHMYAVAEEILKKEDISFEMIKPLISETSDKVMQELPMLSQTGPAIRNNQNIIKKHLDLLSYNPQFKKIYERLSNSIFKLNCRKETKK